MNHKGGITLTAPRPDSDTWVGKEVPSNRYWVVNSLSDCRGTLREFLGNLANSYGNAPLALKCLLYR
jgi:hypothetical protein